LAATLTVPPKKSALASSRTAMHGPVLSEIRRRMGASVRPGWNASWMSRGIVDDRQRGFTVRVGHVVF
jgi:hypothetical protein